MPSSVRGPLPGRRRRAGPGRRPRTGLPRAALVAARGAASLAIKAGAHLKAVQRMLGHASAAMTLDRYADLFDAEGSPEPPTEVDPQVRGVETRGIEPLTPALQRRCSAN
jgi:hypothetical protein